MNKAYLSATKRLDEVLPESIPWLSNAEARKFLGISEPTRKRDTSLLRELSPQGFSPNWKNRRGYNRAALEVLWEFRQLQNLTDREEAIANINQLMRMIYERKRQRASAAC